MAVLFWMCKKKYALCPSMPANVSGWVHTHMHIPECMHSMDLRVDTLSMCVLVFIHVLSVQYMSALVHLLYVCSGRKSTQIQ